MKIKITAIVLFLFISFFSFGQGIIFHEDFEGSTMPTAWSQSNISGGNGTWNWSFGSGEFAWSGGESYEFDNNAAIFDDLLNSDNTSHDVRLLAHSGVDLSKYENLTLEYEFSLNVLITNNHYGILRVVIQDQSIGGWRDLAVYQTNYTTRIVEHNLEAFLISHPGINRSNLQIGFIYDDEGVGYTKAAGIADVKIKGKVINDSCEQAFWLQPGGTTHSSLIGADNYFPYGKEVWYHYVNNDPVIKLVEISIKNRSSSDFRVGMKIYKGDCADLNIVKYGDDDANGFFEAYPGDEYYIMFFNDDYMEGTFDIDCLLHENPINDEAVNAINIPLIESNEHCQSPLVADNRGATTSWVNGTMRYSDSDISRSDIWYKFVAPSTGQVKAIFETASIWDMVVFGLYDSPTATSEIASYGIWVEDWTLPSSFLIGNLTPGNTYYLRLYTAYNLSSFGTLEFCLQVNTPPINNDCTGAIDLGCNASLTGTLSDATVSDSPECNSIEYPNLWYHYSSPNGGSLSLWIDEGSTVRLMVFEGNCESLNCITYTQTSNPYLELETTPGANYYISVGIPNEDNFTIHTSCAAPINDEADNAIEMTVNAIGVTCTNPTIISNNNGATDSSPINGIPSCRDYEGGDLWYEFQAPASGGVKIVRPNAGDWGAMGYAVYQAPESTTAIACHYIQGAATITESNPITGMTPGNYYWLRVWEWENENFGSVEICLEEVETQGFNELESVGLTYSPNPVKGVLYISAKERIDHIRVFNSLGQEFINSSPSNFEFTLDVSKLNQGAYFVKIYIGDQIGIYQIIKE